MIKFEDFLLDNNIRNEIFNYNNNKISIHKDIYNDRFIIIYLKEYNDNLYQNRYYSKEYSLGAYIDVKDKVIYNCDYQLHRLFSDESVFEFTNFEAVDKKFLKEVDDYIEKYIFENIDELKEIAKEQYKKPDNYIFQNCEKGVKELFIAEDNPVIEFEKNYNHDCITSTDEFYYKDYLNNYFDNKDETIANYANAVIKDNKINMGLAIYLYENKLEFLNLIKLNINNEFKDLYQKKALYNSIKDLNAKMVNVTINYNNKDFTFKFDYNTLKRDLLNNYDDTSSFGCKYDIVKKFLKENTINENGRYDTSFKFSHIKSISYGKKVVYKNKDYFKVKNKEKER